VPAPQESPRPEGASRTHPHTTHVQAERTKPIPGRLVAGRDGYPAKQQGKATFLFGESSYAGKLSRRNGNNRNTKTGPHGEETLERSRYQENVTERLTRRNTRKPSPYISRTQEPASSAARWTARAARPNE